jgi:hypothetical protein
MRKAALSIGVINVLFIIFNICSLALGSDTGIPFFFLLVLISFAAGIVGIVFAARTRKEAPRRLGRLALILNIMAVAIYVITPILVVAFVIGAMFIPTGG